MVREVVIIDGVRTPIGRYGGALASIRPDDLLAHTLVGLIKRTGVDPSLLDDVYAGCGNQAGEDNRDVARMAVLLAGFPVEVPGCHGQSQLRIRSGGREPGCKGHHRGRG